jgi:hypothetical protein
MFRVDSAPPRYNLVMDIRMTWWRAAAAAVALIAGASAAAAQGRPAGTAGVTGSWKVSLHGQHIIPVGMELTQDGGAVTGTLMLWNGDVDLRGSYAGGRLEVGGTLTPTDGSAAGERVIVATLNDDGTLAGTIGVGAMGQVKLTAERFKERPVRASAAPASTTPASGPGAPFAGAWTVTVAMGAERQAFAVTIAAVGDAISGTLGSDHAGLLTLSHARVEGTTLHFSVPMTGTPQLIEFHVTLTDPRTITGTMTGPMGTAPITGTRAK